jgi:hypothetical protein
LNTRSEGRLSELNRQLGPYSDLCGKIEIIDVPGQ